MTNEHGYGQRAQPETPVDPGCKSADAPATGESVHRGDMAWTLAGGTAFNLG